MSTTSDRLRRLTEVILAGLTLLIAAWAAQAAWMSVGGTWASHDRLIYSLSTTVPDWAQWDLAGARTGAFAANPLMAWPACAAWAACVWLAGRSRDKWARTLWLLSTLLGTVAAIGAGDAGAVFAMGAAVLGAWGVVAWATKSRPSLKPVWTAGAASLFALTGIALLWRTSFPDAGAPVLSWIFAYAVMIAAGLVAAGAVAFAARARPTLAGALGAAVFAGVLYVGPGTTGIPGAWAARRAEIVRLTESSGWRALRGDFAETRLSEAEASVQRLPRPEADTLWTRRRESANRASSFGDEGKTASGWLTADEALYAGCTGAQRNGLRAAALTRLTTAPAGPVAEEMTGWLRLDAGDFAGAATQFRNALAASPAAPMRWLGMGLAEIGAGRDEQAAKALATWCLLDPRAVFSPAWQRAPLDKLRPAAMRDWTESVSGLIAGDAVSANDAARLLRFTGWLSAWERAGGNPEKFLDDAQAPAPVAGAVRLVRERMRETLREPSDAKIGAILSAGTALLADRHVNLGQCHDIFDAMRAGKTGTVAAPATILISRPVMPGWADACRITEGGAGATLHDFEENLVVRLLTYGHESAHIQIPDKFLREALPK